jgi:hypothetical protein
MMRIGALLRSALGSGDVAQAAAEDAERRILPRHDLAGEEVGLLADAVRYRLSIKDISSTGLSGLTDAALAPGQKVYLLFDGSDGQPATICWIRGVKIGASFLTPISKTELRRLRAAHRLRRRHRLRNAL